MCQKLQHRDINGDGRPPARYSRASLHRIQSRLVSSRRASVPVIPTSSCRNARECLAGGRPFPSKRNIVLLSSRHPPHVVLFSSPSSPHRPVGTHDLCVRCVKSYSIVVLTGMDAQIVRPYKIQSRLVSSRRDGRTPTPRPVESSNTSQRPTANSNS